MKRTATLFCLVLLACMSAMAQKNPLTGVPGELVPGEIVIMFNEKPNVQKFVTNYSAIDKRKSGLKVVKQLSDLSNIYLLRFNQDFQDSELILRELEMDASVRAVQFNHYVENRATTPNDPSFNQQWHHVESGDHDIDSDEAWDVSTGGYTANGDRIVVCVMEGGDYSHPDLIDNHWTNPHEIAGNGVDDDGNGYVDDVDGWNTTSNSDAISGASHGTAVSGMIGATGNNSNGGAGVNWSVGIMHVEFGGLTDAGVVEAYSYPHAMRNLYNTSNGALGAFVVATNASWGIDNGNPANFPVWCAYYDDLGAVGILNCGATANAQTNIDVVGDMPTGCSSDYMVAVTATNNQDQRTFSAYGATTIDLGAPGESVYLPSLGGGYSNTSGTSFASPCVAGAIALVYSAPCADLASNALTSPQATADLVRSFIFDGVDQIAQLGPETVTGGRLNVNNSIVMAMENCNPDLGCTDPMACNYSPEAITDNGNCQYFDLCEICGGDNSSCAGCIDAEACNYDPTATIDDGSCILGGIGVNVTVGGGSWDSEISWSIVQDSDLMIASGTTGSTDICIGDGCYTFDMLDSYGDGWNGATYTITNTVTGDIIGAGDLDTATNGDGSSIGQNFFSINSECGIGCTDSAACNYDANNSIDDGSCNFDCNGCMDMTACNYDEFATQDDGSCLVNDDCGVCGGDNSSCSGCTDAEACNYDPLASIDNGSCISPDPVFGCACEVEASIVAAGLLGMESSEVSEVTGAGTLTTVTINLNWTSLGNGSWPADMLVQIGAPDGSCIEFGGYDYASGACTNLGDYTVFYPETWYADVTGTYTLEVDLSSVGVSGDGVWTVTIVNGWQTSTGSDYDATFTLDGICPGEFVEVLGCIDQGACNYDAGANTDDGSCEYTSCSGCTDDMACNYDPSAVIEDGSCEMQSCAGCMNDTACNYDAEATMDDGSCEFESCDCPEDVNGDGVISVADILVLLGEFGCTSGCSVDINDDDATNVQDILLLLAAFGTSC